MIKHYLKVAIRNLLKYKAQSVISILGLAVGGISWRVWKAANENPAEVIKNE